MYIFVVKCKRLKKTNSRKNGYENGDAEEGKCKACSNAKYTYCIALRYE